MKRKGRQHLPKVGTKADLDWEHREGVDHLEHPFSDDPSSSHGLWAKVVAILVIVALVGGLVGWLIFSA